MTLLKQYIEGHPEITQAELARRIGHDRSNFNRIVNGSAKPTLDVAVAIERETAGAVPASSWVEAA